MTGRELLQAVGIAIIGGLAVWGWSRPAHVVDRWHEHVVLEASSSSTAAKATEAQRSTWRRKETHERIEPSGAKSIDSVETSGTAADVHSSSTSATSAEMHQAVDLEREHIEDRRSSWRLSVSAPASLRPSPGEVAACVERRVLGPVWLGAEARADLSEFRLRVAVEF